MCRTRFLCIIMYAHCPQCRATDIILSGDSAGGIGAFNNIDFLTEKMKGVHVVGNPWAGWYFPNVTTYPRWKQGLPNNFTSKPFYQLYQSYLNEDCTAQHPSDPWYCGPLSMPQLYPFIKTPIYIAENMFDSHQIYVEGACPKEVCLYIGALRSLDMQVVMPVYISPSTTKGPYNYQISSGSPTLGCMV